MSVKECITQLKELIEAWNLNEATLNQTDINAIKGVLEENKILKENNQAMQEEMARTWAKLGKEKEKIQNAIDYINNTEVYNNEGGKGWLYELDYFDELLEILGGDSDE